MKRASVETIMWLVSTGALYINETGIHANEEGIYNKECPTENE